MWKRSWRGKVSILKKLFYALYAFSFNLCRIFPLKSRRVALVSPHNAGFNDSLGHIRRELEKRGGYKFVLISRKDLEIVKQKGFTKLIFSLIHAIGFFTVKAYLLATSKYIFLNDNFMPMANLHFSKKAVVTQLWHAEGAFKKFGHALSLPEDIARREEACNKKLTYTVCSSKAVVPVYAEAFNVPQEKVLPLGSPRTDFFFETQDLDVLRNRLDNEHPECRGKALILYAPTFRESDEKDRELLAGFDFNEFDRRFGDEYALCVRLHPQIHSSSVNMDGAVDVTGWKNVGELVLLCDMLITDYSSICMDFALLEKPCVFYAFDLNDYINERNFYFDYKKYVPGPVAETFGELLEAIRSGGRDGDKLKEFRAFNFDEPDGKAAERVVDYIMRKS